MLPHYLWKTKFKFATRCEPAGRRLVDLLWCLSASLSLTSQTSSLSTREWRSTAAITATCSCHSSCCSWCVTCQAISSSFNKTAHTGHVKNVRFLVQSTAAFFLQICGRRITPTLIRSIVRYMGWRPAASALVQLHSIDELKKRLLDIYGKPN